MPLPHSAHFGHLGEALQAALPIAEVLGAILLAAFILCGSVACYEKIKNPGKFPYRSCE